MALLRLRVLDVQTTTDLAKISERVKALQVEASRLLANQSQSLSPGRIARVSLLLEEIQRTLTQRGADADPRTKAELASLVESIDREAEAIFQKAPDGHAGRPPDLQVSLSYAYHLRFRSKRDECLKVVDEALKSPAAAKKAAVAVVMKLHTVAVETALYNLKDTARIEKATPHIKALIDCPYPTYRGLGHLFQGAIELEQAGATAAMSERPEDGRNAPPARQAKLRASALNHLKIAAAELPDIAEAQARYGVALVLSMEPNLGRQYLQKAVRQRPRSPVPDLGGALDAPGGLPRRGRADRQPPSTTRSPRDASPAGSKGCCSCSREIHQARGTPETSRRPWPSMTARSPPASPGTRPSSSASCRSTSSSAGPNRP